jgi:hypothetical protein
MNIDKHEILSGAMNASNVSDIVNIFYIDRNKGKYQKQTTVNKGDLIETDTVLIDCVLDEHNIDIQHNKNDIDLTPIAANLAKSHIHSHILNYLSSNANVIEYIKFYKAKNFFKRLFSKKTKSKEYVMSSIESCLKADSIVLFSMPAFNDIYKKQNSLLFSKNMGFSEAGFINNRKCYVVPTWTEKSVLIINKNDLDVVISRAIKTEEKDDTISVIIGMGVFKSGDRPISKINLL